MDPLKLLSRSTRLSRNATQKWRSTPSSGQNLQPQPFAEQDQDANTSRKRKRGQDGLSRGQVDGVGLDFFGARTNEVRVKTRPEAHPAPQTSDPDVMNGHRDVLSLDERKRILKQHKLKVTWLSPTIALKKESKKSPEKGGKVKRAKSAVFPDPLQSFNDLQRRYGVSKTLAGNVIGQGYDVPTEVQLGGLPLLLNSAINCLFEDGNTSRLVSGGDMDLLTVAPTGSGKTLAFMIPLFHSIQSRMREEPRADSHTSAIILAPTKELTGQIANEGRKLAAGMGVKILLLKKGTRFDDASTRLGDATVDVENENTRSHAHAGSVVKADIVVATPGVLQSAVSDSPGTMSKIQTLVLDEADVLLDPLFRDQTLSIWNCLTNAKLRVSMWSATMGSNIEDLAQSTIEARRRTLSEESGVMIAESPLIRLVVGLKDSAVANVQHKLVYAGTEQGKLMGLRQLLHPTASSLEAGPPLRPPFLVFTQTIERAIALHSELLYDIPAEAGGINRIAVLHSGLQDIARDSIMTRFRKGEIWVLITTDLLSRGVDFRGINGVVNYDIPTSSAAYVHRVGRTGRAGRQGGVAVTLYSKEDIPCLKHIVNVISLTQKQQVVESGDSGMQQWLLNALPTLSKNQKQDLKKHGIESRTAKARQVDPKAARKARISTKSGFVRRTDNKRKGAILGSQRRTQAEVQSNEDDETDFGGFD